MFIGYVKTKDILLHPISLIRMRGLKGYFKLIGRAISRRNYPFIRMTQESDWIFDEKSKRQQADKERKKAS